MTRKADRGIRRRAAKALNEAQVQEALKELLELGLVERRIEGGIESYRKSELGVAYGDRILAAMDLTKRQH